MAGDTGNADKKIVIYVTAAELEKIAADAKLLDLTRSNYGRARLGLPPNSPGLYSRTPELKEDASRRAYEQWREWELMMTGTNEAVADEPEE